MSRLARLGGPDGFLFPPGARNGLSPAQVVEGLPFFISLTWDSLTRDLVRQKAEERPEPADVLAMPGRSGGSF